LSGKQISKPEAGDGAKGGVIDKFLDKMEDPDYW
jgi:hypothetical protein